MSKIPTWALLAVASVLLVIGAGLSVYEITSFYSGNEVPPQADFGSDAYPKPEGLPNLKDEAALQKLKEQAAEGKLSTEVKIPEGQEPDYVGKKGGAKERPFNAAITKSGEEGAAAPAQPAAAEPAAAQPAAEPKPEEPKK
ncbi:MAG TPA: hypothetical protein PL033_01760 [Candidatus Brocadiia bacterium]|nr:hypothetical protein [Candidatus Brocadiia bacterium]